MAASLSAQYEDAGAFELHQLDRAIDPEPGQLVRVENPYGNIRIREVPAGSPIQLRVTVQTTDGTKNPARLADHSRSGDVVFAIESDDPSDDRRLDIRDDFIRADFVLAVPDSIRLEAKLVEGDFTMHGATYPMLLRADRGHINLRTTGPIDVEVLHGHVVYNQDGEGPVHGGRIQTSSAPVDVLRADPRQLNYSVISGAAVTTDSLPLLSSRIREGRAVRFGLDQTNATLEIQTDSAPVRLVAEGIR